MAAVEAEAVWAVLVAAPAAGLGAVGSAVEVVGLAGLGVVARMGAERGSQRRLEARAQRKRQGRGPAAAVPRALPVFYFIHVN